MLIGFLIGNKKAREWCMAKICETSCLIDKEILSKMKKKDNDDVHSSNKTKSEISP